VVGEPFHPSGSKATGGRLENPAVPPIFQRFTCGFAWHAPCSFIRHWHNTTRRRPDMEWTTPEFVEVKMDAEINSYQDDFSGV
jgi:hypothetical protein